MKSSGLPGHMRPLVTSVAAVLAFLALGPAALAQSSARPSPVDVEVPKPPTPIAIEGAQVLVYELHITNFGPSALTLTGITVFGGASESKASAPIADYGGPQLAALLRPVRDPAESGDAAQLPIGRRVIAFMYVPLPAGVAVTQLRHRFSFDVADPSRGKGTPNDETALDGVIVPVLQQTPMTLGSPFREGIWVAGNGPSNTSVHRRSILALNGQTYIAQRFAIDWVKVGRNGDSVHDARDRNENFWAFGQPVVAPCDGEVTETVDTFPDNTPGKLPVVTNQNILGNHVIVRIAPSVYMVFGHLKQGGIVVRPNEKIMRGDPIGQVGNSGNSTGAHLHFEVVDANSAIAAEGIPFVFDRFRFLGYGKDFELEKPHPDEPRTRTLPADGTVLTFD